MAADGGQGLDTVRAMRGRAQEVKREAPPPDPPPDPPAPPEPPEQPEQTAPTLPPGCPVTPLGVNGDVCWYLDQLGQLRGLKARDHSRLNVQQLFGRLSDPLLYDFWPRRTQDKVTGEWITTGWKPELAAESLMIAAATKGVWTPLERVRGAGAWRGVDGELILHCGDVVLTVPADGGRRHQLAPGLVGNLVYPTAPPTLRPDVDPQPPGPDGPGARMLALLGTWNWRRKEIDAHLLLGWIGAAMLGGALDWRALAWTTGGYGTGKSTLQNAIKWTLGENGILQTADATAAGVRQVLKHSSLPVAIDEAESDENNQKMQTMVKLARDAATGSLAVRGGSDHEATQFTVRSCFLFSSILIPPLLPQDRSRMIILELDKLEGEKSMSITPRKMGEIGARMLRRLCDQWHRWPSTVEAYRAAMGEAGHAARGQDVFGTLLACADLVLHDYPPDRDSLSAWGEKLAPSTLAELEGEVTDETSCLNYLLSTPLEMPHDRRRFPIGRWIARAGRKLDHEIGMDGVEAANRLLQEVGLKVVTNEGRDYLAVANQHRGLARVFDGTQWAWRPGAIGAWVQSLRRLPHVIPRGSDGKPKALWFGVTSKATLLPLHLCLPVGDSPPPNELPFGDAAPFTEAVRRAPECTGAASPSGAASSPAPRGAPGPGPDPKLC